MQSAVSSSQSAAVTSTSSPKHNEASTVTSSRKNRIDEDEEDEASKRSTKRLRGDPPPISFLRREEVIQIAPHREVRECLENTQCYISMVEMMVKTKSHQVLPLSAWNLPEPLLKYYREKGIQELFPWQVQALLQPGVFFEGRNLVYSAPTSAGKSLVGDMLAFKTLFEYKKKVIIILPFVSISLEKVVSLKNALRWSGIIIESFAGNVNPKGGFAAVDVAVCTIEKANNMINRLIEEKKLDNVGLIVVDELHMLADSSRGYLLELLLSKLMFASRLAAASSGPKPKVNPLQLVGMSATIPNLPAIAAWLNAELFITDYRPVPLYQRVVRGDQVFEVDREFDRAKLDSQELDDDILKPIEPKVDVEALAIKSNDPIDAALIYYAMDTIAQGFSALVFCPTKLGCEKLARSIAENIYEFGSKRKPDMTEAMQQVGEAVKKPISAKTKDIIELLTALRQTQMGFDRTLETSVKFGVAFHHAGISHEERALIERGFRDGTIKVLCSTTTLSAGVNLPARRVLISSPFDYRGALLGVACYRQMIGRAGRAGIDTQGESMLFCQAHDFPRAVTNLVRATLQPIKSCLIAPETLPNVSTPLSFAAASQVATGPPPSQRSEESLLEMSGCLKRAILEVVANGMAYCMEDVNRYIQCTFLGSSQQNDQENQTPNLFSSPFSVSSPRLSISEAISEVSRYLNTNGLIIELKQGGACQLAVSELGKAIVASGVTPDDGQFILRELSKLRENLCQANDLLLIYQLTPPYIACNLDLDWKLYLEIWQKLNDKDKQTGEMVGVSEGYIIHQWMSLGSCRVPKKNTPSADMLLVHQRFFASLALQDLVQEVPVVKVASRYNINKGHIQSLQQQSATFAGMLNAFCERLGRDWDTLTRLIQAFQPRLAFGVQLDLVDLMRCPVLTSVMARKFYNHDLKSLAQLINCQPEDIERVLIEGLVTARPSQQSQNSLTSQSDPTVVKLFVPYLDHFVTIRELSTLILEEARIALESEMDYTFEDQFGGKPVNGEEQTSNAASTTDEVVAPADSTSSPSPH